MASAITLHGLEVSPYYQRVAAVLRECGVDEWENVPVNPLKGETSLPAHLALNPFGKIPVYQDADVTLYESRAISRYVLEKHGAKGGELLGSDARERAEVNKWVDVESTMFTTLVAPIINEALFKPFLGKEVDQARLEEHVGKLSALLDVYEQHLSSGKEYLALDRLTLADITHLPHTQLLMAAGHGALVSSRPHVAAWWERISSIPSWAKVQERPTIPKLIAAQKAAA